MRDAQVRRVPVVSDMGRLVGAISRADDICRHAPSAGTHRLYPAQPSGSASRRTAGITAWPAPSRSPGRTPRPRRRAGRPGCASAAADPRTAGGAPPARHPPRRPQSRRSPDTSTATAAARRPRSASGSQSTAQDASPDARDASSEDEPRSDAGRSRYRPLPSDSPPTERCARAIRLQHSTLLTVHTPSPPPNPHSAPPAPSDTSVVRAHAGALRGHRCLGV